MQSNLPVREQLLSRAGNRCTIDGLEALIADQDLLFVLLQLLAGDQRCLTGRDPLTKIAFLAVTSVQEGDWAWMALAASEEQEQTLKR